MGPPRAAAPHPFGGSPTLSGRISRAAKPVRRPGRWGNAASLQLIIGQEHALVGGPVGADIALSRVVAEAQRKPVRRQLRSRDEPGGFQIEHLVLGTFAMRRTVVRLISSSITSRRPIKVLSSGFDLSIISAA